MRYAECDACGRSLIGAWHINITRVTKPKGKHRNQKKTTINRLCGKCWTELKKNLPEKPVEETHPDPDDVNPPCSVCGGAFRKRSIIYEMNWTYDEGRSVCSKCFKKMSEKELDELGFRSIVKMIVTDYDWMGMTSEFVENIRGLTWDELNKEYEEDMRRRGIDPYD